MLISIHALREEGDKFRFRLRRESRYFYPRPPRGGRRHFVQIRVGHLHISIHALREEGDAAIDAETKLAELFLSTPSARRATLRQAVAVQQYYISIHALREEGDPSAGCGRTAVLYFYPRPPRGGRLNALGFVRRLVVFLSTPSARRATDMIATQKRRERISIHALREEGDPAAHGTQAVPAISIHALREEGD